MDKEMDFDNEFSDYDGPYKDIIYLERPVHINDDFSAKHPKIPRADRAKIFSSFAALKDNLTSRKQKRDDFLHRLSISF